jgi:hypothetical protein
MCFTLSGYVLFRVEINVLSGHRRSDLGFQGSMSGSIDYLEHLV